MNTRRSLSFSKRVPSILQHHGVAAFTIANGEHLCATPGAIAAAGPFHGEHTDEILRDVAGLDDDEIARLRADGVLG